MPAHLPVDEIEIHPEGDLTDMICIGKEVTEELECEPARFFIRRYIRYKYTAKNGEGVKTGELPERVIDKGIPGAGLLAMILTDKYADHLPLYRQKQRFARETGSYVYDDNGNMTTDGVRNVTIGYNALNLPVSVTGTGSNTGTVTYQYDGDGNKQRSIQGTTTRDYDPGLHSRHTVRERSDQSADDRRGESGAERK